MLHTNGNIYRGFRVNTDDQIEVVQKQDVSKLIRFCEDKRSEKINGEEFRHYAEIPVIFVEKWMQEYGITEMNRALTEIMFRKVNEEFQAFKVTDTKEVYRG